MQEIIPVLRIYLCGPLLVQKRASDGSWEDLLFEKTTRSVLRRMLIAPGRRATRLDLADDL